METFSVLLAICAGNSPGTLMFSLIYARINGWVKNREAGDLRRYRAHHGVIVMSTCVKAWQEDFPWFPGPEITKIQNQQWPHGNSPNIWHLGMVTSLVVARGAGPSTIRRSDIQYRGHGCTRLISGFSGFKEEISPFAFEIGQLDCVL